jgi:hypothetical protein
MRIRQKSWTALFAIATVVACGGSGGGVGGPGPGSALCGINGSDHCGDGQVCDAVLGCVDCETSTCGGPRPVRNMPPEQRLPGLEPWLLAGRSRLPPCVRRQRRLPEKRANLRFELGRGNLRGVQHRRALSRERHLRRLDRPVRRVHGQHRLPRRSPAVPGRGRPMRAVFEQQ